MTGKQDREAEDETTGQLEREREGQREQLEYSERGAGSEERRAGKDGQQRRRL